MIDQHKAAHDWNWKENGHFKSVLQVWISSHPSYLALISKHSLHFWHIIQSFKLTCSIEFDVFSLKCYTFQNTFQCFFSTTRIPRLNALTESWCYWYWAVCHFLTKQTCDSSLRLICLSCRDVANTTKVFTAHLRIAASNMFPKLKIILWFQKLKVCGYNKNIISS